MKIRKFKFKQLLKLHLLKSRVHEHAVKKTNYNDLIDANLDKILVGLKKALQVIFQYNQTNKRILFIGLPSKLESKINSVTRHTAVSSSFTIHGLISNNNANLLPDTKTTVKPSLKRSSTLLSPKLVKKPDLVVLFDHEKSQSIIAEAWTAKIPVITFTYSNDSISSFTKNSYSVNGNFKSILETLDKNVFFVGLNFLFKNLKKKKVKSSLALSSSESHSFVRSKKESL